MFLVPSDKLTGSIVLYTVCTEDRFLVVRTKRTHLLQVTQELGRDLFQIQNRVNIQLRNHLFRNDMFGCQLEEPLPEGFQILFL